MTIQKVALGYWYQRTSLHLAEINDFLQGEPSPLDLNPHKLAELRHNLQLESVKSDVDVLERLDLEFKNGIKGRIYEDGLVVLTKDHHGDSQDIRVLSAFFNDKFLPAINYLFSLGAPVPKELAHAQSPSPIFIVVKHAAEAEAAQIMKSFHPTFIESGDKTVRILKGGNYYLINILGNFDKDEHLIEALIFFKEFKAQLHHYLNLHRILWEKIEDIKEKGTIRGKDVGLLRTNLDSYKKTIELISGRMDQMNLYIPTRSKIVSNNGWQNFLTDILEFQYDNLDHNLQYIKSLWGMTSDYIDSAIQIFGEIASLSTRNSVNALTIISSIGVISGVLGFLATDKIPNVTHTGFIYFSILLIGTVVINRVLKFFFSHIKYKISDIKIARFSAKKDI